jgi:hypothetical protein
MGSKAGPTEADYFRYDNETYSAAARLGRTSRAAERADLFAVLAFSDRHQSKLHTAVFGHEPYSEEDPTTAAEWMADSSRMLWLLGAAELARSQGGLPAGDCWLAKADDDRTRDLARAVEESLRRYAAGGRRRRNVSHMVTVWAGMTGGQAVEAPYCMGLRTPWWAWR